MCVDGLGDKRRNCTFFRLLFVSLGLGQRRASVAEKPSLQVLYPLPLPRLMLSPSSRP